MQSDSLLCQHLQVIREHRLVFTLNNNVIRTFPVSVAKGISGVVKLIPVELLLIIVSAAISLLIMWYTKGWVNIDPEADDFAFCGQPFRNRQPYPVGI